MGRPMVLNLFKVGYKVKVYNQTPSKVTACAKQVNRPRDIGTSGGIVITMVANDHALEKVVVGPDGFGEILEEVKIHLSMSTVTPETPRKLADFHQQKGSHYFAPPIFGRPEAEVAQKLFVLH
jgi:3-hydroxyisobutyrate dehydrogenase-like beta-hydroxyacid dehydrogenase